MKFWSKFKQYCDETPQDNSKNSKGREKHGRTTKNILEKENKRRLAQKHVGKWIFSYVAVGVGICKSCWKVIGQ